MRTAIAVVCVLLQLALRAQGPDYAGLEWRGGARSVKETSYKAIRRSGAVKEGRRARDKASRTLPHDFYAVLDSLGRQQERTEYFSNGRIFCKLVYTYDSHGNVLEETRYGPDGSLEEKVRFVYAYDAAGRVTEKEELKQDSVPVLRIVYKYDTLGRLAETVRSGPDGKPAGRTTFRYDAANRLAEKCEFLSDGEQYGLFQTETYTRDSAGRVIEKLYREGNRLTKYQYKYDPHNNIIAIAYFRKNGTLYRTWTFRFEYDAQGNWTRRTAFCNGKPKFIIGRQLSY